MTASTATVAADEVTPYARKALIASTAGYAMDGFDFLILGFMLTAIRADLGLSQSEAASLATWTLLGAVAGGIGFGILSDHLGRIRVLTWTILLFAVFTGLSALARGHGIGCVVRPRPLLMRTKHELIMHGRRIISTALIDWATAFNTFPSLSRNFRFRRPGAAGRERSCRRRYRP